MSSLSTISPASLHDLRDHTKERSQQPHHLDNSYQHVQAYPATSCESHLLSPYSSRIHSSSASPTGNSYTPADSISSAEYSQPSDIFSNGEFPEDPFLATNFNEIELPSFLAGPENTQLPDFYQPQAVHNNDAQSSAPAHPISLHKTPSVPSSLSLGFASQGGNVTDWQDPAVYRDWTLPSQPAPKYVDANQLAQQLTPDTNVGGWSSDESLAPAAPAMAAQSPRVTVSMWRPGGPVQGIERSFTTGTDEMPGGVRAPHAVRAPHSIAGDLAYEPEVETVAASQEAARSSGLPSTGIRRRGLAPAERPSGEVPSLNQQSARRERRERNEEVAAWVSRSTTGANNTNLNRTSGSSSRVALGSGDGDDNIPAGDVPLGDETENRYVPGQAYLQSDGRGEMLPADVAMIRESRIWGDAPTIQRILTDKTQPATSQAAIEKFNKQCHWDNESVVSHAATWGTRRRSLPSIVDMDGVISGNFFKKLSISTARRPSFIKKFSGLNRRPSASQLLKRRGSNASDNSPDDQDDQVERRESKDSLAPPTRTTSWGLGGKQRTPSLNTALVGMATGAAAIGTTHARSGSISAQPSPKSPFGSLSVPPVKHTLRRPRSKTELPRSSSTGQSHPNLVGMLKKQGGPPVAQLARTHAAAEEDEDEDGYDEGLDDADFRARAGTFEPIEPTLQGFRDHVIRLNPRLDGSDNPHCYLVDRIAYQMILRLKGLQEAKVAHLRAVERGKCSTGNLCIALGGAAVPLLDGRMGDRGGDPLAVQPDSSDGDATPIEGLLNSESFPAGIPMPPSSTLPAEFECQLCFLSKRCQKPSDWTKHVHEDVQPFTCTWDSCRDPKMFKRKADWVRHENEGHRHLEWWTCDVEDCHHTCYRRDNFLQHLVREHKFAEPKAKTKAAIKKAGGGDPTWQKVEQCHVETPKKPSEEPCRFCGKTFPTWKKLTVHLAKHMETISLPVLQLVDAQDLDADTVISPVQDPPPRSFGIPPQSANVEPPGLYHTGPQAVANPSPMEYHQPPPNFGFVNMSHVPTQNAFYPPPPPQQQQATHRQYGEMSHHQGAAAAAAAAAGLMMPQQYNAQPQYHQPMPVVTTAAYAPPLPPANAYLNLQVQQGTEPFPAFNPLGIQNPAGGGGMAGFDGMAGATGVQQQQQPGDQVQYGGGGGGGGNTGSTTPYSHSPHHGGHGGSFYGS
ncbi:hypothetical protein GGR56DRAFT_326827 [Xylariaceae sp. FL0804]|nr:hypothetical protein GGR56DRAFT_326827 [Xylariaceae sp. FL0804]